MKKLFKDLEVFTEKRPEKLTEKQENEIWEKLAKEVIEGGWSNDNIDVIIEDLKNLSMSDSGYEMAKDLEGFVAKGNYKFDTSFIEWLDMLYSDFYDTKSKIIKEWVKVCNIKPKYKKDTKLIVKEYF